MTLGRARSCCGPTHAARHRALKYARVGRTPLTQQSALACGTAIAFCAAYEDGRVCSSADASNCIRVREADRRRRALAVRTRRDGPMPPHAAVLTVVALRPAYLPGLSDKDSADVAGDIFFWMKDRILRPMHCRRSPSWGLCASGSLLLTDNVADTGHGRYPSGWWY